MARGRPPIPVELRELQGRSHKAKSEQGDVVVIAPKLVAVPPVPVELQGSHAETAWRDLAPILVRANLLDDTNLISLQGLCVNIDVATRARQQIASGHEDLVLVTERGSYIENPIYAIERRAWQQVLRFAVEFGMTPSARARLGLTIAAGMTLAQELQQTIGEPPSHDIELPDLDAD